MTFIVMYMTPEASSDRRKGVFGWLGDIAIASCFLLLLVVISSPRFDSRMEERITSVKTVPAHVEHCELVRDGDRRENAVRCSFVYTFEGQQHNAASTAWRSNSPFTTSGDLARALAAQSRIEVRPAHVHHYAPDRASLIDDRWMTAPSVGTFFFLLFVACMWLFFALFPSVHRRSDMVYRRADFDSTGEEPDSSTGAKPGRMQLVEAPGFWIRSRMHRRLQVSALGCAALLCLYCLTNRPGNLLHRAALTGLQPVAARLTGCTHAFHGQSKGNDEINCGFQYVVDGKPYTGRAEAIDFRLFPTEARMDAQVLEAEQSPDRVAYVDPQHPTYALAYISNDWVVPYSWGIFEALVAGVLFVVLPKFFQQTIFPKE
jgi:hypothetical protein